MNIAISSGHGKYIRGASGYLDEVNEARRVVDEVSNLLADHDIVGYTFHDDESHSQSENLERIVDFHNSEDRELDVSVHFNAYNTTQEPMGCECLYLTKSELADTMSKAISMAGGFKDRGGKKRDDLYFLNKTNEPAILIEVCFVDSEADADLYHKNFEAICKAIAAVIAGLTPVTLPTGLTPLVTVGSVTIKQKGDGQYIRFISDLDVCNDGTGPSHGDPHYCDETAYYNGGEYLNADEDKYIVIPPQVRELVPTVVMGCKARLTNLKTEVTYDGVTGEIGPNDKTGEAAYCLAKIVNPAITHNSGDKELIYLYELWPDVPAVVDGKTYKLEPA